MDKKSLKHLWKKLHTVRPWYFLIAAVVFGVIGVYSLRQNNLTMIRLRDKVYQADKDNTNIEGSLRTLREYVYAHMNTDLTTGNTGIYPPIQLKYSYDRAIAALSSPDDANNKIYTQAQAECEKQFPHGLSGSGRIPCIQDYIASHGIQSASVLPPASLYTFDFVSPRWSPDLAGLSLLAAAIFALLFIIRIASEIWLRFELRD